MKFVMLPTWDIPPANYVERGDTSRFMALPMPGDRVESLTANDSTIYPVVMTTEQLCKWWHRVRRWKVIANHPLWPVNQQCTLTLDESNIYSLDEEITMDKETATDWYYAGSWTGNFTWDDPLAVERTAYFTLEILRKPSATIARSYSLTGDFTEILPYLRLQASGDGIDGNLWAADSAAFYDGAPAPATNGTASATIDGLAPTITAAFDGGSGFEDDPMTLTLTPSLYWEYRDANGQNPKYDALTGAKI